ncbi:TetR/AcrR family transcriptional regulator [Winogradskya humida]|uniref:TetR family transcriptional regulator n=1 Tax=Winogradskya humida TaxID=113566 RepID=A0ABQ3ZXU2_9ACTN|nr:TetR family transcriptional regulator [Actinoplanes humidus]GIE23406.1 TetR family transcriptional regulator [Actinoplanes humidus]
MTEPRRRNAARTRQLLLDAARQRFAHNGYAATTLREIADDAGVNIALVSRYFESKEGLFSACLTLAADEFRRRAENVPLERIAEAIAARIGDSDRTGTPDPMLLLLLRSSGDARADEIRLDVLRGYGAKLAAATGADPDGDPQMVLRANIVLAATTGMLLMRLQGLEPLASATKEDLVGPLRDMVDALLSVRTVPTPAQ